eukprot:UC1_evm2s1952
MASEVFGGFLARATTLANTVKSKAAVATTHAFKGFNEQQARFERQNIDGRAGALPPWMGYADEEDLRERIVALSADERNFIRDPPSHADAANAPPVDYAIAMATLAEDKRLEEMRFKLVPGTVSEERFWRNYFYRVELVRQAYDLEGGSRNGGKRAAEAARATAVDGTTRDESLPNEVSLAELGGAVLSDPTGTPTSSTAPGLDNLEAELEAELEGLDVGELELDDALAAELEAIDLSEIDGTDINLEEDIAKMLAED